MAKLGFVDNIKDNSQKLDSIEQLLGGTLMQPFSGANSGANLVSV